MDDNWQKIIDRLSGTGNHAQGVYADCPFCHVESSRSKAKFLIIFEDGVFKSYNCLICHEWGSGSYGLRKLAESLSVQINAFSSENRTKTETATPNTIIWPPTWIKEDEETIEAGLAYLASRAVPEAAIPFYDLQFTSRLDIGGDESYIIRYPSILAPHTNADGEVFGWSARQIPAFKEPGCQRPKTYMAAGKKWKEASAFGLNKVNPEAPITIVEGFFDTLSTPNSVSFGGKGISKLHMANIKSLNPSSVIFALDADVQDKKNDFVEKITSSLSMTVGRSVPIHILDWDKIRRLFPEATDPASIGRKQMTAFIKEIKKWSI